MNINYNDNKFAELLYNKINKYGLSFIDNTPIDFEVYDYMKDLWIDFFKSTDKYNYKGDISIPSGYHDSFRKNEQTFNEHFFFTPMQKEGIPHEIKDCMEWMYYEIYNISKDIVKRLSLNNENISNKQISLLANVTWYPVFSKEFSKRFIIDERKFIRLGAHKDKNFFTLSMPPTSEGFEALIDDEWRSMSINNNQLALLSGTQMGDSIASLHRVTSELNKTVERLSILYFVTLI